MFMWPLQASALSLMLSVLRQHLLLYPRMGQRVNFSTWGSNSPLECCQALLSGPCQSPTADSKGELPGPDWSHAPLSWALGTNSSGPHSLEEQRKWHTRLRGSIKWGDWTVPLWGLPKCHTAGSPGTSWGRSCAQGWWGSHLSVSTSL